jgi:hypothetical protein
MKQNSLIEIGSKANVIIRFLSNTNINNTTYLANEPFLYLKEVQVVITYESSNPNSSAGTKKVISNSFINPTQIMIESPEFNKKICSLLTTYDSEDSFYPTKFITLTAEKEEGEESGIIWLTEPIKENSQVYAYDSDYILLDVTYDSVTNTISSTSFEDGENYLISFSSVESGTKFILVKPCIPYMSIEIQGIGNIDKEKKKIMAFFSKVSIQNVLELNFLNDDRVKSPLVFNILDGENYMFLED